MQRAGLWYPSSRVYTRPKPSEFQSEKFLSTRSFGGEVKPSVPCRSFTACKRSLNVTRKLAFRQNYRTFPHSSTFRRLVLSRGDTRGDAWWRKLERLTQITQEALRLQCVVKKHKTAGFFRVPPCTSQSCRINVIRDVHLPLPSNTKRELRKSCKDGKRGRNNPTGLFCNQTKPIYFRRNRLANF